MYAKEDNSYVLYNLTLQISPNHGYTLKGNSSHEIFQLVFLSKYVPIYKISC